MPLFQTIDQVREFVSINSSLQLKDLLPFIRKAETLQIRPILGAALYNSLHEKVNTTESALSAKEKELLDLCRDCVANFAVLLFIPHGLTQISGAGIHQAQNNTKKAPDKVAIQKLESAYATAGYQLLDDILEFLEGNEFPDWENNDSRRYYLHSTRQFAQYVNIGGSRRTYLALQPIMERVENSTVKSLLGEELHQALKAYHQANSEKVAKYDLLLDYVRPLIAYHTIARGITELSLNITDSGINVFSSSTTFALTLILPADNQRLSNLRKEYQQEAAQQIDALASFLHKNIEDYPEFKTSRAYIPPAEPITTPNAADQRFYFA